MKALLRLLVLCSCVAVACASGSEPAEWIAAMHQADRRASELQQAGKDDEAAKVLKEALSLPATNVAADDARIVRQDLYYRLAALALSGDRAQAAERWATEGLALGRKTDVFTANLLVIRGRANEVLGEPADASVDYHQALVINEALLEAALGE